MAQIVTGLDVSQPFTPDNGLSTAAYVVAASLLYHVASHGENTKRKKEYE